VFWESEGRNDRDGVWLQKRRVLRRKEGKSDRDGVAIALCPREGDSKKAQHLQGGGGKVLEDNRVIGRGKPGQGGQVKLRD